VTDGQNYDSQDRASIAASRGKNEMTIAVTERLHGIFSVKQKLNSEYTFQKLEITKE